MTDPSKGEAKGPAVTADLLQFATTERHRQYIEATLEHGSYSAAARALGVAHQTLSQSMRDVLARAARQGYAPGHWDGGVAPGYLMGKVTVQRGPNGVERTWERMSPDQAAAQVALRAAAEAMAEDLPRVTPTELPQGWAVRADLCNLYPFTDYHIGMAAWAQETGADWDMDIAEALLIDVFSRLISAAPRAHTAVIWQGGDFLHFDSLLPVTVAHRHVLDAAGRMRLLIKVSIRVLRRLIALALEKHEHVHVIMGEGNHDETSSGWLQGLLAAIYENEPRVTVDDSQTPFYAFEWGQTMLAFHHGHKVKPDQMPLLSAARFPEMWGRTKKRYAHLGHHHHLFEKEHSGMKVKQHPTLSAPSSYDARQGYDSEREVTCDTYHNRFGRIGGVTITPEMAEAA